METTKTDHSLQNVLSKIRMWKMLTGPLVVSAPKREVGLFRESLTNKNNPFSIIEWMYIFSIKQVPVVDSVKMLEFSS